MKKGIIIILSLTIILLGSLSYVSAMDSDGQVLLNDNIQECDVDDAADSLSTNLKATDSDSTDAIKTNEGNGGEEDNMDDVNTTNGNIIPINPKTFSELLKEIKASDEGSVLILMDDCSLNDGFGSEGIPIEKQITLDGNGYSLDGKSSSRILYVDADNVVLKNIKFINGANKGGGGALLIRACNTLIENCTFEDNTAKYGGAIFMEDYCKFNPTTVVSNTTIINSNFEGNSADNGGGAIYSLSKENFIKNTTFKNNHAKTLLGGAIQLSNSNSEIVNNVFIGNSGKDGGAVALQESSNHLVANNTFTKNSASYDGGALNLYIGGGYTVINNVFNDNIANELGGAIRFKITETSSANKISDNTFNNNKASDGAGAIYCDSDKAQFTHNTFINNKATSKSGGAIQLNGKDNIISYNVVEKCSASYKGGAFFIENNANKISYNNITNCHAGNGGGAIFITGSSSTLNNNNIRNNGADSIGGAIQISGDKTVIKDNVISDNVAKSNGGGLYIESNNAVISGNTFVNDKATSANGGAIWFSGKDSTISYNVFDKCSAPSKGGALLMNGNSNKFLYNDVTNCNANSGNGGAIYWYGDYGSITESSFTNCHAANYGGGIYFNGVGCSLISPTFKGNTAKSGQDWYSENSVNVVTKTKTILNAPAVSTTIGTSKNLVVTLTDANKNVLAGEQISINFNNVGHTLKTNSKGQVSLAIPTDLAPKTYVATIRYAGNSKYASSTTTANVIVNKLETKLTAKYDANSKNIVATVKDANGKAISGLKVGFAIDGVKYVTTDANGQAEYSTNGLSYKEYSVTVRAYGNDLYGDSNKATVTFDLSKIKTTLTAPNVVTTYNSSKTLVATLKDAKGNVIGDANVTVKLGNTTKVLTTDKNGQVSLTTNGLDYNTYAATITFAGDDTYAPSNTTSKVTITNEKQKAKVYLRNALYFVLQTKMVQVTLWDADNNPIAGKTVYLKLDEYTWKYSGVTDENGNAYIKVGVGFGVHPATVSFEGDNVYTADSKTGSVRVIKETPSLMLPGKYTKFQASNPIKTVRIYLKDRYDKPLLPGTKVFIKVNGQTYSGLIDLNGIAYIGLKINTKGTYNAELIYTGNTAYNAVRKTTKITIV